MQDVARPVRLGRPCPQRLGIHASPSISFATGGGARYARFRSRVDGSGIDVLVAEFDCDHNPAEIVLRGGAL
jgi:hypothetical protein